MFVILTSKPGQYRTEIGPGLRLVEAWDYLFYGRVRAHFVIAELQGEPRVRVIDEVEPPVVNEVPSKFLEKYVDLDAARRSLQSLSRFGGMDIALVQQTPKPAEPEAPPEPGKIAITFVSNGGKRVRVAKDSNLLRASLRESGGIPFKCGAGLCGTCKCRIVQGLEHADAVKAKERKHLNEAELAAGYRMACQTFVAGDVSVSW